jgi:membrane-bound lytic murein transglycosylase A
MKQKSSAPRLLPLSLFSLLLLTACSTKSGPDHMDLEPVSFNDLPGWQDDHVAEAIPVFARSCEAIMKKPDASFGVAGTVHDWQAPCAALAQNQPTDNQAAREFFEHWFRPYATSGNNGEDGLFTGYYEADLRGSWTKTDRYQYPLWAKPRDLVSADLGKFKTDLKGQHIVGKVDQADFVPYDERAEIEQNSLDQRARPLLWVDDQVDAFFLGIQGSGRVHMTDGETVHVGYDGTNGRPYVAIGRALTKMGEFASFGCAGSAGSTAKNCTPITMQLLRGWLEEHPDRAQQVMNLNPSYVFFHMLDTQGPIGSENVALTPLRSLAVDPAFVPLGAPVWLATETPEGEPFDHLLVAQDTGGAIKGAVRGDVFWGAGPTAEKEAGAMQSQGRYFLLLPKDVQVNAGG